MVGEAAKHMDVLASHLTSPVELVALPREAAETAAFDSEIDADDVVVSLKFSRGGDMAPPFRLLHVPGAGLDRIDVASLRAETALCNVYEHEVPIAEYTMACVLESTLRLDEARASFTPATWGDLYRARPLHGEVAGKRMGIIGYGRIGRAIADRARPFGLDVVAIDAQSHDGAAIWEPTRLLELLATSDFVVVAVPLLESTRGLLSSAEFAAMRSGAILINISRAEIVDEHALHKALTHGGITGAHLDVWYRYPSGDDDHPAPSHARLLDLPNVWASPHIAAWTTELPNRRYRVIAENINRLVRGEDLVNQIDIGAHLGKILP